MEIKSIDLYMEFDKVRPDKANGMLRCYLPQTMKEVNDRRAYPAILILPGGGYRHLSPREAEPVALRYLAKGFVAFVLEYSVAPCRYPTAFLEAAMAMRCLRENAQSLSIDASKIAGLGFSAGGHLCGCLATMSDAAEITAVLGGDVHDYKPDAVILAYPVVTAGHKSHAAAFDNLCGSDDALKQRLSLENCVTCDSSPAFIWHTYKDQSVSVYNSLVLAMAYEENGASCSLHIFEKGIHGLSTADWGAYPTGSLPDVSTGLTRWIDMSVDWLADRDIRVKDQ